MKLFPNSVREFRLLFIGEFPAEKRLPPPLPPLLPLGDCDAVDPPDAAAAAAAAAIIPNEEDWW